MNDEHTDAFDPSPSVSVAGYGSVQSIVTDDPSVHPSSATAELRTHVPVTAVIVPRGVRLFAVTENCSDVFCPSIMIQYDPMDALPMSSTHVVPSVSLTISARHDGAFSPSNFTLHPSTGALSVIESPLLHPLTFSSFTLAVLFSATRFSMFTSQTTMFDASRVVVVRDQLP